MSSQTPATSTAVPQKCACESCHCIVQPGKGVARDGKVYCSATCAYDCTKTTCVCVHAGCK
jgi:hypothetical protein